MTNRLGVLRRLASEVGQHRYESHRFFPAFADRLVLELSEYLGDPGCVALCCASGEFSFGRAGYGYDGLRIENGIYRVPVMLRLASVTPQSDLLLRVRLFFTRIDEVRLTCQIEDSPPFDFVQGDLTKLKDRVFRYLSMCLQTTTWFAEHPDHFMVVPGKNLDGA